MSVVNTLIERAVTLLSAAEKQGVVYEIRLPDGTVYGGLPKEVVVEEKKRTRARALTPYGSAKEYVAAYLTPMQIGDVVVIPVAEGFPSKRLQSVSTVHAGRMWGTGAMISSQTADKTGVEIMRIK